ncbi:nuclear transport factor 2 family protein [Oenococcus kitaharae]|uniref:Uncharacterized protein n=1 Tax=Oenococcus kitaharae DSM 17330 TaxID=1045004 RepID=G9WFD5_9LACO|nr:nuclear transport factor 2 family protein [Oenococcus kitaharae]EHN59092.1 hypothetical protein OKIT_0989 [Oenococcus kitaharae DSM 17330]
MNDTQEIENLIDDYATFADTRQADSQLALFTDDAKTAVYFPGKPNDPQIISGSQALLDGFSGLNQYEKPSILSAKRKSQSKTKMRPRLTFTQLRIILKTREKTQRV